MFNRLKNKLVIKFYFKSLIKYINISYLQVIAAIAAIDIPRNQWPDLIQILLENVTKSNKSNLKQASLQTIGYTCELIV